MTKNEIKDFLCEQIEKTLKTYSLEEIKNIDKDEPVRDELDIDSLSMIELVYLIDDGFKISPNDLTMDVTFNELIELIEKTQRNKND